MYSKIQINYTLTNITINRLYFTNIQKKERKINKKIKATYLFITRLTNTTQTRHQCTTDADKHLSQTHQWKLSVHRYLRKNACTAQIYSNYSYLCTLGGGVHTANRNGARHTGHGEGGGGGVSFVNISKIE